MLPSGSYVALITPMDAEQNIQWHVLHQLIDWHLESKTHGIVILGTTGEAPTITARERVRYIEETVERVAGKIPVIVGAGTHATNQTCERIQEASLLGADACMLVTPYYNKPNQDGLYEHFKKASTTTNTPILLYNVPTRTGVDLLPKTVVKLSEIDNIIGIKDATGSLNRLKDLQKLLPSTFMKLSGDDTTAHDFMKLGGHGVISVIANIVPQHMSNLCRAALINDERTAAKIFSDIERLIEASTTATNPIPIKYMMHLINKIGPGIRLPLTQMPYDQRQAVKDVVGRMGLMSSAQSLQSETN